MAPKQFLDAHERPPEAIREAFKLYSKMKPSALDLDPDIMDFHRGISDDQQAKLLQTNSITKEQLMALCSQFGSLIGPPTSLSGFNNDSHILINEVRNIPGLHILPALLPPSTQRDLLSRLLHRDLSNERHMTNLHKHYELPYALTPPENLQCGTVMSAGQLERLSFFTYARTSPVLFRPKDPDVHKSLPIAQVLQKKLRWLTLGGQYDWTNKMYPREAPPPFPRDIADLLHGIFPEMEPQAAIVNLYSPGDTLSIHRDVSEDCDRGLISVSLGCDGLFVIGLEDSQPGGENEPERYVPRTRLLVIRLRSGDAIYMSGEARYAWHGVPKVIANTCPTWLEAWPAAQPSTSMQESDPDTYNEWRGWIANKRINLNVRQMHD
ncbi:MAG: hypothetical protein M1812_003869 [Candelaria pacifica]|nr:MAG: hypothetical protein M1812_003869 [Candelaria pacifica]